MPLPLGWVGRLLVCALALSAAAPGLAQAPTRLVFLAPDLDPETRAALSDALWAQLTSIGAELVLLESPADAPTLDIRLGVAKALAAEHEAVGVLWLEARLTDHWFVYAMDAQAERIVVRPLLVRPESLPAAIESVAVIARSSAEALLRGEPVQGQELLQQPVPAPPQRSEPAPAPPSATRSQPEASNRLRLSAAYSGNTFAREVPWQNALSVTVSWLLHTGAFFGLGYQIIPSDQIRGAAVFSVGRHPLSVFAGYRVELRPWSLDAELAFAGDLMTRRTQSAQGGAGAGQEQSRLVWSVSPGLRAGFSLTPWLSLFAGLSSDILLNNFQYLSEIDQPTGVLAPHPVRLRLTAGLAIVQ